MNRLVKIGLAALAFAVVTPSFAQETEAEWYEDEGVVGWTPVALGIATPVQLPWGMNRWDVFGLDVNLLYADAPKMYGLDVAFLATVVRNDMCGIDVSGLANFCAEDVYGIRATLGLNATLGRTYGIDAGAGAYRKGFWGLSAEFLGSFQNTICGCTIAGLANVCTVESCGAQIAIGGNFAKVAYGLQVSALFNMTEELHGCQIALLNYAETCPNGFQIGLLNIIRDNRVPCLPFVNGYF